MSSFCTCWATRLGAVAHRLVGVHLGEERADRRRRWTARSARRSRPAAPRAAPAAGRCADPSTRDRGQRELLLAAGADPVEPVVLERAGAGGWARSSQTALYAAHPPPRRPRAREPPQSQSRSERVKIAGEVVGADLARARSRAAAAARATPRRGRRRRARRSRRRTDRSGIPMSRIRSTRTPGSTSRGSAPSGRPWPGSSSRAAARCRSGSASKVHRNASGAVSATAMPCGTIGSSAG